MGLRVYYLYLFTLLISTYLFYMQPVYKSTETLRGTHDSLRGVSGPRGRCNPRGVDTEKHGICAFTPSK